VSKFRAFCRTTGLITVFRTAHHCYLPNSHASRPHSYHNPTFNKPHTKTDIRFAFLRNGHLNLPCWTFILRTRKLSISHPLSFMLSRYSDQATSWTSRLRFPARREYSSSENVIFSRAQQASCPMRTAASFSGRKLTFWRRNYFVNFSTPCI